MTVRRFLRIVGPAIGVMLMALFLLPAFIGFGIFALHHGATYVAAFGFCAAAVVLVCMLLCWHHEIRPFFHD